MNTDDLIKVVVKAKDSDRKSFELLYTEYFEVIYRYVYKKIRIREISEEITQEVFLESFIAIKTLKDPTKYLSWLYSICQHNCVDYFRSNYSNINVEHINEYDSYPPKYGSLENLKYRPDDYCIEKDIEKQVINMINGLNPDMRKAIVLYYYKGISISEIAKRLGISENATKQKLYQARKKLKKQIKEFENEGVVFSVLPITQLFDKTKYIKKAKVKICNPINSIKTVVRISKAVLLVMALSITVAVPVGLFILDKSLEIKTNDDSLILYNDDSNTTSIIIPNLINIPYQEAENELSNLGLKVETRKTAQALPIGRTVYTAPFGGHEAKIGGVSYCL